MTQPPNDPARQPNGGTSLAPVADELKRESERLRRLADELQAREEALAEMRTNYPHLKQAVYSALREQFERELPPLPDRDLEALAAEEGALPLDNFIDELVPPAQGRG